jgi:WhiB family redox-sensing transcriptional regulator
VSATPEWMLDAACLGKPSRPFFPERGERDKDAKAVCEACGVRPDCLRFAMDERIFEGVWGGLNADERRSLLRRRQKAARERRTAWTAREEWCEAATNVCRGRASQLHHRKMRSHGGTNDPENLLAVCAWCHDYIHSHPAESYEAGWLIRGVS